MNRNRLAKAICAVLGGGLLLAQTGREALGQVEEPVQLERLSITGSRIKRTDIESASPLLIIERDDIERTGLVSLGRVLQSLPIAGSSRNTQFPADGATTINLRNLGSSRVLVLLNGRRFVTDLEGTVDLNNIPAAIVERVEILKDGASSIYGSDAITGVINVITRRNFEGLQANAYVGQYHPENDGETQSYDLSVGASSDQGSVFLNVSYVQQDSVIAGDRRISAEPLFGTGLSFANLQTPQGTIDHPDFGFITTDPGANVTGPAGLGADAFRPADLFPFGRPGAGSDRYNFAPTIHALTPQERTAAFAQGTYQVTDAIRLVAEAIYNRRESKTQATPAAFTLGSGFAPTDRAREMVIAADNVFNPFGIDFLPGEYGLQRRLLEAGSRILTQDVESYRFGLGFEGHFEAFERYFEWDLNYVYADLDFSGSSVHINAERMANALSGQPCRDDLFGDGCVELNLFGGQGPDGTGTITRAMLDYILFNAQDVFEDGLTNYTANLTGEILDLPAGPLAFAVGYEYRLHEGRDRPDAAVQAGLALLRDPAPALGGSFSVDEYYLEFAVPLLAGTTGAERLQLSLSSRLSDYDSFGETTNSKIGIEWQPIDDLLIRGTFSEGFRAPTIADLFFPRNEFRLLFMDPCNGVDTDGDDLPDTNPGLPGCVGIPGTLALEGATRIIEAPNPDLGPESSESVTLGLVYSPGWLEGMDLSVDLYRIELDGTIDFPGPFGILNACANTGTLLCSAVTRDPVTGRIQSILLAPFNLGGSEVEGLDFQARYAFPETPWGHFRILWDGAYQGTHEERIADGEGGFFTIDNLGFGGGDGSFPRWKSNLNVQWTQRNWEANWNLEYIHATDEECSIDPGFGLCNLDLDGDGDPSDGRSIGATTYHDVQLSYHLSEWNARLTLGVRNLFDKGPPLTVNGSSASYNRADHRLPGRFPYLRMTVDF